ncbi:nuclease-like protein [Frondihabitans sp. PhB188]|uniref:nuclease-related domain-containing protein n=1 Tax=Frondihabitans sp. PhB188 TaxID=2485200 RepID=UPI000F4610CF|nr:nuclease-related domain-containing protein [Frondihabitans sp. PhB188]ROQ38202.1 nuclease-like protein [Frondihabitans sp. PhB188]
MTIPAPTGDAATAVPVEAAPAKPLDRLWSGHSGRPPRGPLARVLGASPISPADRSAFTAALAEAQVAERLRTLAVSGGSWRVLHGVPVGGSEIDHLVIGPAGVFAITVGSPGDAEGASALLSHALGRPIAVSGVVVATSPRRQTAIPGAQELPAATAVSAARLASSLRGLRPVLSVDEVREVTRAALRPRTWRARPLAAPAAPARPVPARDDLHAWFGRVRTEVAAARRVQTAWALGGCGAIVALAASGPALAQSVLG